ncbi:MAG: NAD(P)/FAD-dependent oxidoreductase [Hyphomicrobiales bacterium]
MYDAIVVGARCAGSPTAMLLARAGHRVLLVDRARFPSDTVSTHALTNEAVPTLAAWGVLDRLVATNPTPVYRATFRAGGEAVEIKFDPPGYCPRRTVLDAILVDAARESGAEVREGFSVSGFLRGEDGRITGIRGRGADGREVVEEARVVVGADGRNSILAREVKPEEYNQLPALTCGYFSYFETFPAEGIELNFTGDRMVFVFPTNDGLCCVGAECLAEQFPAFRADVEGTMAASFAMVPGFPERVARARRVERWTGIKLPNWYYRKPFGPGWALVGDAGYLKDPVLGMGMNDAFRDAGLVAKALDDVLSGRAEFDAALGEYQRRRDTATAMMYQLNYEFSKMRVGPEHLQMIAAGPPPRPADAIG